MVNDKAPENYQHKFLECDERFEAIFGLTSAASKIIDSNLTIIRVNQALVNLLGYSSDELVGTQIMDYACEDDKRHWHELQEAMWHKGKPNFQLDACIVKKDRSLAWVHVTTILFKENEVAYAYTILDDFTSWKQLQESERRLSLAVTYSKMAVWELNLETRAITRSEGFEKLFGLSKSDEISDEATLLKMFEPEDRQKLESVLNNIHPGQNFDFQGRILTPDGIIKWINFQGKAERDAMGAKILGTLYDITRDKMAEREKDDFISIASHELKTPLTALKGSLQVLERMKENPTPMFAVMVKQAAKSMDKVTNLVDELLNAGRVAEGQLHLKTTRFNISRAIDECCLHVTAAGTYQITVGGEKDLELEGDSERIQRVIVNFVNNAVKYAPQSKEIAILVSRVSGFIRVSVTDQGPGIPADRVPYLFDRFYRADQNGMQYSGLGLGLYISAEIIKKHNGHIGVDSQPGTGSTFWFELPA
ncbi:two-component system CheB/CheR fusion protein [Mucilaginibacter rubeus]|uniref:sensor histidine kinase n=1 Tax=Mucilaginibacter rubeus TaxID=2027860 RepID=UPI0033933B5A